jgi:alpha-L-fucosidase
MLGVAPDNRGLLPDSDVARLREFGAALKARYSHNLALAHSGGAAEAAAALDGDPETFWSAPAGSHHAALEVDFAKPVTFNRALTMEWLNDGQHVQKYAIEVWDGRGWKAVASAQAIGHEKIDEFAPVTASRVRLNILSSSSEAHIREFQLYNIE